jgi:type VI secretion system secreted protein Hcp
MANMFLDLENVIGESADVDHRNKIEVYGWTWGIGNNAPFSLRDKSDGTPHATVENLTIEKMLDSASVTLAQFCANGTYISKGYLACKKNTGGSGDTDYLKIELTHIKVISVNWPGKSAAAENLVSESVILQFAHFDLSYQRQAAEGQLYGKMNFPFDVPTGKGS